MIIELSDTSSRDIASALIRARRMVGAASGMVLTLLIVTNDDRFDDVIDAAKEYIVTEGSDPLYGARPLKRYLQSKVETLLARKIIATDVAPDTTLVIDVGADGLYVK